VNEDTALQQAGYERPMTRDELRAYLDRKPPPGSWRDRAGEKWPAKGAFFDEPPPDSTLSALPRR
jgi:hypothetical protein